MPPPISLSSLTNSRGIDVVVAGVGMATVGGITARQTIHAVAGDSVMPSPSPFRRATLHPDDDERVQVLYAPWLGAWSPLPDRLYSLALLAADEAVQLPTPEGVTRFSGRLGLVLVHPAPRADLQAVDLEEARRGLAAELRPETTALFEGDAGLHPALREAHQQLAKRKVDAVLLVAVDSFVTLAQARREVEAPASWWRSEEPRPSEAGVALLLMRAVEARARGASMASILSVDTRVGASNETNEEIVDGLPMTALLLQAREHGPFAHVFGQGATSPLRGREWELGLSRSLGVLADEPSTMHIERTLGRLGAAAAPASLAFAAMGAWHGLVEPSGPALVWSISDDGVRGLCAVSLRSAEGTTAEAAVPFVGGERLRVHRLEPIRWETRHLRASWDAPAAEETRAGVYLDPTVGSPTPLLVELRQWVLPLLDDVRILGRHRSLRQYADSRKTEARIVRRINRLVTAGAQGRQVVRAWWEEQLEGNDPWRSWALALALGVFEGGLGELPSWLAMLPEDAREDAQLAGEAIAVLPSGASSLTLREMVSHAHGVVRAAAFVAASRLGRTGWDTFEEALSRAEGATTVDVALWEAAYVPQKPPQSVVELLRRWVGCQDGRLAWHAARAVLVHGDMAPYEWLLATASPPAAAPRPGLAQVLGARSFEMIAMVGRHEDSAVLTKWLRTTKPTASVLDALARFGNVEVWGYLLGHLADDDLREPAARALEVLFGLRVPEPERHDPGAWRAAIEALDLDPRKRTRLGVPFAPAVFDREVRLGEASRAALEMRQAELCARYGRLPCRPLHGLSGDAEAALGQAALLWNRVGGETAGAWA